MDFIVVAYQPLTHVTGQAGESLTDVQSRLGRIGTIERITFSSLIWDTHHQGKSIEVRRALDPLPDRATVFG